MISLPQQTKIVEEKDGSIKVEIEGLYPGYGATIGNSLRRVLLSSLPGAAVTQVKIKGAQHEFSTISGVLEDVVLIIMNLKEMKFKLHSDEPQKAILKVSGEKKVKGSDFKLPSQMELVNKDCHIATLTSKKSELEMEIQVEKGIGYEMVEQRKKDKKLEIGVIPIDAVYSPIKRVSFKVENMRVGKRTDFDKVSIDIETDNTVSPKSSFRDALQILIDHFSMIKDSVQEEDNTKKELSEMAISARTESVLADNNIKSVAGLLRKSEEQLKSLEGMGDKGIEEIKKALSKLGLELKHEKA